MPSHTRPKADADAADTAADSADEAVEAADATDTSAADAADADAADADAAANVAVAVEGVTGKGEVTSPKNKAGKEKLKQRQNTSGSYQFGLQGGKYSGDVL